jgi:hypothetical protein
MDQSMWSRLCETGRQWSDDPCGQRNCGPVGLTLPGTARACPRTRVACDFMGNWQRRRLAIGACAVLIIGACHATPGPVQTNPPGAPPATTTPAGAPKDLAAATAAAQQKADRHASGDFAGEWLLFTKDLRDNITQQAFVEFSQKCSPTGLVMKSSGGRMDSPERAVIHFETMGVTHAVTMIYEYGGWYKEPDEFLQANFGKNGNDLIAVDQAAGHCDSQ